MTIMKTIKYLAIAAAVLAASSCLNESAELSQTGGKVFTAAFAEGETKAVLKPGVETSTVEWETTDHVSILAGESNWDYAAQTAGTATTLKSVSESAQGDNFYALYPYDATATLADGVITTVLPAEQTAVPGSFSAHMAVAYTETNALAFKNVCGLVRVKVMSEGVTKVVFEGKSDEYVAGKIDVTVAVEPAWAATAESSKTVALVAEGGKTLAMGDYYLATLPQRFQSGFTVKVYCGETLAQTKDVDADLTLQRCQIVPGKVGFDVESIAPTIATVGETITVTGYGFTEGTKVKINGAEATVSVTSSTSLAVTVPAGLAKATDYKLSVEVPGFDAVETAPFRYFYLPVYKAETVCGSSGTSGLEEGVGNKCKIHSPYFIGEGSDGQLWFTCAHKTSDAICKFDYANTKAMTIFVSAAEVTDATYPYGGAFDASGNLHIALKGSATQLGKVTPEGEYSTYDFYTDMGSPMDICFDKNGIKYVAERNKQWLLIDNGTSVEKINLDFRIISLDADKDSKYLYMGSDSKFKIFRMDIATREIVAVAGDGTKPVSGTAFSYGTRGNPLTANVGNVTGLYVDPSDGYIYYLDQQYCTMNVLIPGVGGDAAKGVVLKAYGTNFNNGFLGSNGGQLTKASDGNFYVTANGKHKIGKVYVSE